METAKIFETVEEMKQWFSEQHENAFSPNDVVIGEDIMIDDRIGWKTQYVCTKRYHNEDFIKKYGCPQCIGMCDLDH